MDQNEVLRIELSSRKYPGLLALVDARDFKAAIAFRWWPVRHRDTFYACTRVTPGSRRVTYLHKFLLPEAVLVDHKDGNGLNCTRGNLRPATRAQNNQNQAKTHGKFPYKGVRQMPGGSWQAKLTQDRRQRHLGTFLTAEEAARAYDQAVLELFGEFARLNFPEAVR